MGDEMSIVDAVEAWRIQVAEDTATVLLRSELFNAEPLPAVEEASRVPLGLQYYLTGGGAG